MVTVTFYLLPFTCFIEVPRFPPSIYCPLHLLKILFRNLDLSDSIRRLKASESVNIGIPIASLLRVIELPAK